MIYEYQNYIIDYITRICNNTNTDESSILNKIYAKIDIINDIYDFIKSLQNKKELSDHERIFELICFINQLPNSPRNESLLYSECKYNLPLSKPKPRLSRSTTEKIITRDKVKKQNSNLK
jgi:hypothetical protein